MLQKTFFCAILLVAVVGCGENSVTLLDPPRFVSTSSITLTTGTNQPDWSGECVQFTTNAEAIANVTWSVDNVITDKGQLASFSMCPDWSWYNITTTAKILELTIWSDADFGSISTGTNLTTVKNTITPLATASATYYPLGSIDGDGSGGGGGTFPGKGNGDKKGIGSGPGQGLSNGGNKKN